MPHISKHAVSEKTKVDLEKILVSLLQHTDANSRKRIFREILTSTERLMLAKRLSIIFLIRKGLSIYIISKRLRVSPSTVARFERALEKGVYRYSEKWVSTAKEKNIFVKILSGFFSLPFDIRRKSLAQLLAEHQ